MHAIKCDICKEECINYLCKDPWDSSYAELFPNLFPLAELCFKCFKKIDNFVGCLIESEDQANDIRNAGKNMQSVLSKDADDK